MINWFRRRPAHLSAEALSAYLDGELSSGRAARARSHLAACERCQARLDELRSLKSLLSGLPRTAASRSFVLTPEQAGLPARRREARSVIRAPVINFAPAVALTLLVALLAVDFAVLPEDEGRSGQQASNAQRPVATESLL